MIQDLEFREQWFRIYGLGALVFGATAILS